MRQVPYEPTLALYTFKRHYLLLDFHHSSIVFKDSTQLIIDRRTGSTAESEALLLTS